MKSNRHGFTLIELLIVVAIIGILVSIALPIVNKSRDSAKNAAAKLDTVSIVKAVNQYYNEYRHLPLTPKLHSARQSSGTVTCDITGLTVGVTTERIDVPGTGWHHHVDDRPDVGHREMAKVVIATLQGANSFSTYGETKLNPRQMQFLHIQEGRPIGHFMDPWSEGLTIESNEENNRQYGMLFDHNLNGLIRCEEFGRVSGHDGLVHGELVLVRCAGANRRIEVAVDLSHSYDRGYEYDDIYSIDMEEVLKNTLGR